MIDQSHNLKGKMEAMVQTVMSAQELWLKAASDAGVIIPWASWVQTGDKQVIEQNCGYRLPAGTDGFELDQVQ